MPKECNKEKLHKLLITLFWKIVLSTAREVKHVMRQKLRAVSKFKFPSIKKKQLKDTINKFAGYQKLIMVIRSLIETLPIAEIRSRQGRLGTFP